MATSVIKNFIAKALFKKKGAIANNKAVNFSANALEQRLINIGIDPNAIRSEQELNQILNLVKQAEDQAFNQRFGDVLSRSNLDRKGEVFDMTGKKIDPSKGIMGGKEVENTTGSLMSVPNKKGLAGMEYETDAAIKTRLEKGNKETTQRIKNRKMVKDAIDNASPGFVRGDRKYNAQLVADDLAEKKFGKEYYDLDQTQQLDLYDEALEGYDELTRGGMPDPEDFAQGGRAGYKFGLGPLFNFLNKKSPAKAYMDYLESVKKRMKAGKEAEVAGEVIPIAAGGALITNQLKKKLKAMNEEQKKKIEKEAQEELRKDMKKADGGRIGYDKGSKLTDFIDVQAEGTKSGKQQIEGAPEGITADRESINAIIKADIPISQKIDLLAKYQYGKGRTKIERDGQEIFLDEGGAKNRDIGFGFNKDGEGIGGTLMYNMETGEPEFNIGFKKSFADGGRIGFKDGMSRRSFLKILGGLATLPIVGKFLKPIKTAKGIKSVPIIKTENVAGKPEWFDALVNKVIIEGDDVTKKFATGERQSIHQKTLDDGSVVRVTEDVDDGAVRVEYESEQNTFADTVQLEYKKPLPDEGAPDPAAEFSTAESGPVGRRVGPDDYDIDVDEVGGSSISDLDSDVSKLKEYATGQKLTMKEFIQSKKRRDRAKDISVDLEAQSDAVVRRQGDYDGSDYETFGTGDDYASGGIARMLGE